MEKFQRYGPTFGKTRYFLANEYSTTLYRYKKNNIQNRNKSLQQLKIIGGYLAQHVISKATHFHLLWAPKGSLQAHHVGHFIRPSQSIAALKVLNSVRAPKDFPPGTAWSKVDKMRWISPGVKIHKPCWKENQEPTRSIQFGRPTSTHHSYPDVELRN